MDCRNLVTGRFAGSGKYHSVLCRKKNDGCLGGSCDVGLFDVCTIGGKKQFVAEMQHFADCILGKCECMATADDGINVMKILDAIYESAKTGHEVIIK